MTPGRRRRIAFVVALVLGGGAAAGLTVAALRDNVLYFYSPADLRAQRVPALSAFRLGGLVVKGSVRKTDGTIRFVVTDGKANVAVVYRGLPPALFAEGQGVVATGRMNGDVFSAEQLLARHDEKYTPPEVTDALKRAGRLDGK
jgi:cytochrome c-type biogenesis protein CcmE